MSRYFLAGTGAFKKSEFKTWNFKKKLKILNNVRLLIDHTSLAHPPQMLGPTTMMSSTTPPTSADS